MDLLVGSLMADGGLESSLQTAIKVEIQDIEDAMEKETVSDRPLSKEMTSSGEQLMSDQAVLESETKRSQVVSEDASAAIPLLHLVKQLLRWAAHPSQCLRRLAKSPTCTVNVLVGGLPWNGSCQGQVGFVTVMLHVWNCTPKMWAREVNPHSTI